MTSGLDAQQIVTTLETLRNRIDERFPGDSLGHVCGEVLDLARATMERCASIRKPLTWLRVIIGIVIAVIIGSIASVLWVTGLPERLPGLTDFVQILEPAANLAVLIGAVVFFLLTAETRIKRRRALDATHELRALAHVVDIHTLTMDPDCLLAEGEDTDSSPKRELTPFQMSRYLDYCSETLSLIGKIAALYADHIVDSVALNAIESIEILTTNLSRKIWQKIMMLRAA